jgi:hypothetical protein
MTNPHNVDICVTCVSDKPPQLPLREELPSLGIEVVYNAHGVGAKASKHESKKLLKKYREAELLKAKKTSRFFSLSSKKGDNERQRDENEIRIPKALSYQSYQKELQHVQGENETDSSVSSWETNSTLESSDAENKGHGNNNNGRLRVTNVEPVSPTFEKSQSKPPRTVEIPKHSPEEMAIQEAFKIFSDPAVNSRNGGAAESRDTATQQTSLSSTRNKESSASRDPSSPADRESSTRQLPSSGLDPSTITSISNGRTVPANVRVAAAGSTKASLPGLSRYSVASRSSSAKNTTTDPSSSGQTSHTHGNSTLSTVNDDFLKMRPKVQVHSSPATQEELPKLRFDDSASSEEEEGGSQVSSLKNSIQSAHSTHSTVSREKGSGGIKVKLMSSPNNASQTSEFIDLTAFSDNESSSTDAESSGQGPRFRFDSESMSKDFSTLSSKHEAPPRIPGRPRGVQVYPSPAIHRQLPGLRLHIPEVDDGFGRIILDLSSVCEEDGHLSLVGSPTRLPVASAHTGVDPHEIKSEEKEVIHSPYTKRPVELAQPSGGRALEDRQYYDIMESPTYPTRHTSHGRYDNEDDANRRLKSLIDDASSKSLSQQSKSSEDPEGDVNEDGKDAEVIHSAHKSYSQDSTEDGHHGTSGPHIPTLLTPTRHHVAAGKISAKEPTREAAPLSPSLKQSMSKDSQAHSSTHMHMHVSFSQELEEHHYDDEYRESFETQQRDAAPERIDLTEKQDIISYEDCFKIEEKSKKNKESIPDIELDLSADADETFNAFLQVPVKKGIDLKQTEGPQKADTYSAKKETEVYESRPMPSERLVRGLKSRKTQDKEIKQKEKPRKDPEETGKPVHEKSSLSSPEMNLLNALSQGSPLPRDFMETLDRNPDLARNKLAEVNLYPLHAACTRGFPDRFREDQPCHVVDLVHDAVERRNLIASLVEADPSRSRCLNKDGDLPVHLLARQLMEWEARWYQKVYEKAREDSENELESGVGITRLYQTMSQCIDLLLKPVSSDSLLCQRAGSTGKLLPLHIAAIFTVSYETLKMILEAFEEAATMKCSLENIRTFIPNNTSPLELHDRLSTDFPKWEIEGTDNEDEIDWTQSALDKSYGTKGSMRRSDLMFAFNPDVLSYRSDKSRIRRLESRIRREIEAMDDDNDCELSRPVQLLWIWMCTFEGSESGDDNYTESVKRIVQSIPARSIKALASLTTYDGRAVLDKAIPQCVTAIHDRLDEIGESEIPIPMATLSSGFRADQRGILLRQWEHGTASRFCLQGRGFVGPLCRSLFNIRESNFPTSFVFLPYKLVKDSEGRLGLESAEAANIAMQFADCLLHLTDPEILLHFLEKKSVRFLGKSLRNENKSEWVRAETKSKEYVNKLLNLYKAGPAYFYYLDEFNGVPIVLEDNSIYPLVVNDSVDMIRKVLPLMLTGMTLMRGEKAIAVLTKILLDPTIQSVQNHWLDAAKDILGYMYSPQTEWTAGYLQDLLPLRESLVDFVERGPSEDFAKADHNGLASEWVVELSLVKMVVEMHDSKHTYAGVKPRRSGPLKVLWTKEPGFLNPDSRDHVFFIDFKSTVDLKEMSSGDKNDANDANRKKREEHQMVFSEKGRSSPDSLSSGKENTGYNILFGELSLIPPESSESSNNEESDDSSSSEDGRLQVWEQEDFETMLALKRSEISSSRPISLLDFDDDLDLDSVLQLRILLDEQEAKLEFLKEKIIDIEIEERDLLEKEEKLGEMLDGINNAKNDLFASPTNQGLSRARTLLHRICELEDRVLCREVEVGQLKNEIACFELDASREGLDVFLFDGKANAVTNN